MTAQVIPLTAYSQDPEALIRACQALWEASPAFRELKLEKTVSAIADFLEDFLDRYSRDDDMAGYAGHWARQHLEPPRAGWHRGTTFRCLSCQAVAVAGGDLIAAGCPLCGHRVTEIETVLVYDGTETEE